MYARDWKRRWQALTLQLGSAYEPVNTGLAGEGCDLDVRPVRNWKSQNPTRRNPSKIDNDLNDFVN